MAYLKLVRPLNLLMILFTLLLFRFCLVDNASYILFQFAPKLDLPEFGLLTVTILLVTAGGYVINDLFDAEIDRVNRPGKVLIDREVDSLKAYNYYKILVAGSIVATLLLAFLTGNIRLATVPVLITVALNFYAQYFKSQFLVGNIVVAVCSAFVILLPGLYESEKATELLSANQNDIESGIFLAAAFYALFAFLTTFLREVVKDMEDLKGDEQYGCRTIPIVLGQKGAKWVCAFTVMLILAVWTSVAFFFPAMHIGYAAWVIVLAYMLPLLLFLFFLARSVSPKHFHNLSNFTKIYMLIGILSIFYFLNGTGPYLFLQYLNYLKKLI